MTDEEINIAVAESLGWTDCHKSVASVYGFPSERVVVGVPPQRVAYKEVPNYASDLNVMFEIEKSWITSGEIFEKYLYSLMKVTEGKPWNATARQRAEIYLEQIKEKSAELCN
jgi:hypothetical protein